LVLFRENTSGFPEAAHFIVIEKFANTTWYLEKPRKSIDFNSLDPEFKKFTGKPQGVSQDVAKFFQTVQICQDERSVHLWV
jgi:hypothetical protein